MDEREWFVLPGMRDVFFRYLDIIRDYLSPNPTIHDKPLMIIGDSGSGKELFISAARKIFELQNKNKLVVDTEYSDIDAVNATFTPPKKTRKPKKIKGQSLRLNCASFGKDLAESEIFGHVKGSFTGATTDKEGIVEATDGGLLILDEIGELLPSVQAKLLIFIEEGEYRQVGSNEIKKAKVKIIGTTNKKQGDFRPDFWYRFFPIFLPALHERRLDVLYYIALKYPGIFKRLTPQHALSLLAHCWPGNVRELERVISIILSEDKARSIDLFSADKNAKDPSPLFFPLDQRQTSLANIYLGDFCTRLLKTKFDLGFFNSVIASYGLQVPYSFSTLGELAEIKNIYEKNLNKFEYESKELSELAKTFIENKFDPFSGTDKKPTVSHLKFINRNNIFSRKVTFESKNFLDFIQELQYKLNMNNKYYYKNTFNLDKYVKKIESIQNIMFLERNKEIEKIGACFDVICKIFLKNKNSNSNIFDESELYVDDVAELSKHHKQIMLVFSSAKIIPSALEFVLGKHLVVTHRYKIDESWTNYVKDIINDNTSEVESVAVDKNTEVELINFLDFTEVELLKKYYAFMLKKFKSVRLASKYIGMKESTLWGRLRKLKMLPVERYF